MILYSPNTPSFVYNDNDIGSFGRESNTDEMAAPVYDTVYSLYCNPTFNNTSDTVFTATKAITSTSHVFPYYDIDSSLPAICNEASSNGNNGKSSVTVTTKTYELLQATFILILSSLIHLIVLIHILILSLFDVYSSYDVYFTSRECVVVQNGFNPLHGCSP